MLVGVRGYGAPCLYTEEVYSISVGESNGFPHQLAPSWSYELSVFSRNTHIGIGVLKGPKNVLAFTRASGSAPKTSYRSRLQETYLPRRTELIDLRNPGVPRMPLLRQRMGPTSVGTLLVGQRSSLAIAGS